MSDVKLEEAAFPCHSNAKYHYGMTLRDWFAGQALAVNYINAPSSREMRAAWAYELADAMIKEREKKQ